MNIEFTPVPCGKEGYPVKPYRYYMDDFDYPDQPHSAEQNVAEA